jgi:hypothetical protein
MKRFLVTLATAGMLVGLVAGPVAAAGVQRNQVTTSVYHLIIGNNHTFTLTFGCGNVITATGSQDVSGPTEDISATLSPDGTYVNIILSTYEGGWGGSPYAWTGGFPVAGGPGSGTATVVGTTTTYTFDVVVLSTSVTSYANHGAYVTAMGGGDDAAHSCIGMPIVAQP